MMGLKPVLYRACNASQPRKVGARLALDYGEGAANEQIAAGVDADTVHAAIAAAVAAAIQVDIQPLFLADAGNAIERDPGDLGESSPKQHTTVALDRDSPNVSVRVDEQGEAVVYVAIGLESGDMAGQTQIAEISDNDHAPVRLQCQIERRSVGLTGGFETEVDAAVRHQPEYILPGFPASTGVQVASNQDPAVGLHLNG